jgi:nucleoside 2-deoxyribosyltransferase
MKKNQRKPDLKLRKYADVNRGKCATASNIESKSQNTAVPLPLYLAHPFDSRESVRKWELEMEKKFPMLNLVNPFYDTKRAVPGLLERVDKKIITKAEYYSELEPHAKKVVIQDLEQISKASGTVAVVDGSSSYGTIMEIAHSFLMNKPVYIIVTNGHIKHPWLQFHANELFESFEDFEKYMKKEFKEALNA